MQKIKKAVIPAAGLGTRMLPISKSVPKEMLPIVDRPAISFLVEEAVAAGAEDILIITGRGKDAIENYFDYSIEYEQKLSAAGKQKEIDEMRYICSLANVYFLRQKETRGLGHAVLTAKSFIADEPFFILYGDDVILSDVPVCAQLADAYAKFGLPCCGVKPVPWELVYKYCSLKADSHGDNTYHVTDMIEKPKPEQVYTNLSILGRVLMTPDIFGILEHTAPGAGGEIQLTDAMGEMARTRGMTAVDFEGERFDFGSKLGFLMANVKSGIHHPEIGEDFKRFLVDFVKTLSE
ncbi:MAG: UTP--glucose-1-phosphate uridylyltransferase [Ruminococcaceae bacterium]|nr:UTP--glucose-1-phosphate uridylyltransferase [Oscillospiraceae bacterium]